MLHSCSINEANTGASVTTTGHAHSLYPSVGKRFGRSNQVHPRDYLSISLFWLIPRAAVWCWWHSAEFSLCNAFQPFFAVNRPFPLKTHFLCGGGVLQREVHLMKLSQHWLGGQVFLVCIRWELVRDFKTATSCQGVCISGWTITCISNVRAAVLQQSTRDREKACVFELYSPGELLWSYFNNSRYVGLCTVGS